MTPHPPKPEKRYIVLRERIDQQGPRVAFGMFKTRARAQTAIRRHAREHNYVRDYWLSIVLVYITVTT